MFPAFRFRSFSAGKTVGSQSRAFDVYSQASNPEIISLSFRTAKISLDL